MTAQQLQRAEARYQRASARADALMHERDALVLRAIRAGMTYQAIGDITGLSKQRIGQIALKGKAA